MDVLWFRPVQPMPTESLLGARWGSRSIGNTKMAKT